MGTVLVVGCASFDTLHINHDGSRQTYETIGGAGLYTALAAANRGAKTFLFGPRPDPMPDIFKPFARMITWIGPDVSAEEMPRLEIEHHGQGRATLLGAAWESEALLKPHELPAFGHLEFDIVHIAALSSAEKQLQFALTLADDQPKARISAGTYAQAIKLSSATVCRLIDTVDLFFMNENESHMLYGDQKLRVTKPGRLLFVTNGASGATCYSREGNNYVPAIVADERDPTGAGDTFCGAMLAGLSNSDIDVGSALSAAALLAGKVVECPGPQVLMKSFY